MKRALVIALVSLSIVVLLMGCSGPAPAPSPAPTSAAKPAPAPSTSAAPAPSTVAPAPKPATSTTAATPQKLVIIRYTHEMGPNTAKFDGGVLLSQLVARRLAGRVEVRLFPNGQLYKDLDALDAIMAGNSELVQPTSGNFAKWVNEMKATEMPNLFTGIDDAQDFMARSEGNKYLKELLAAKGMKYLGQTYPMGGVIEQGTAFKKRVINLEDQKGLKIRVSNPAHIPFIRAEGGNAITIAAPELIPAFQQGTIDGAATSLRYWSQNLKDIAPYFTVGLQVIYQPHVFVTSLKFWNALPADVQAALQQCIDESSTYSIGAQTVEDLKAVAQFETKDPAKPGLYNIAVNKAVMDTWAKANQSSWVEYEKDMGKKMVDLSRQWVEQKR